MCCTHTEKEFSFSFCLSRCFPLTTTALSSSSSWAINTGTTFDTRFPMPRLSTDSLPFQWTTGCAANSMYLRKSYDRLKQQMARELLEKAVRKQLASSSGASPAGPVCSAARALMQARAVIIESERKLLVAEVRAFLEAQFPTAGHASDAFLEAVLDEVLQTRASSSRLFARTGSSMSCVVWGARSCSSRSLATQWSAQWRRCRSRRSRTRRVRSWTRTTSCTTTSRWARRTARGTWTTRPSYSTVASRVRSCTSCSSGGLLCPRSLRSTRPPRRQRRRDLTATPSGVQLPQNYNLLPTLGAHIRQLQLQASARPSLPLRFLTQDESDEQLSLMPATHSSLEELVRPNAANPPIPIPYSPPLPTPTRPIRPRRLRPTRPAPAATRAQRTAARPTRSRSRRRHSYCRRSRTSCRSARSAWWRSCSTRTSRSRSACRRARISATSCSTSTCTSLPLCPTRRREFRRRDSPLRVLSTRTRVPPLPSRVPLLSRLYRWLGSACRSARARQLEAASATSMRPLLHSPIPVMTPSNEQSESLCVNQILLKS